jgi:SpoVK/Ycf46/Vps4 family AAA+-type ATPase
LTAGLLGKVSGRPVYRIDLSQLVSKYIGETEKNLEKIFKQAEKRNWILFFDEADSLFGKRTNITDAHDRYANQGTAYLLQRIEDCPNVVILASNYKTNIDDAFSRRFQSTVFFPMPQKNERLKLWKQGFSPVSSLESAIDLDEIARRYEVAGGAIMNAIRYSSLMAIKKKSRVITYDDLLMGIQREFNKEGRTI